MYQSALKIFGRTLVIACVFTIAIFAAFAREDSIGNTFATNGIDLKIDSEASYNGAPVPSGTWALKNLVPGVDKFFNFDDIKPGDFGENTISMHVKKGDAWLCLDFKNLIGNENSVNEPESIVDTNSSTTGELLEGMEFFSWVDDGDNIFELGERPLFGTTTQSAKDVLNNKSYPIGDAGNGRSCGPNQARYIGIFWCAGNLNVNLQTAAITCDGSVIGNEAQTDSMHVDISIRAMPSKENPKFACAKGSVPPPATGSGSISGVIFHDKNENGKKGANETVLSGWTINLYKGTGWWQGGKLPIVKVVSDADGKYIFSNLPDGTYSVEQIIKKGWNQITSDYWSVTVSNGAAVTNKDFGNIPKPNKHR